RNRSGLSVPGPALRLPGTPRWERPHSTTGLAAPFPLTVADAARRDRPARRPLPAATSPAPVQDSAHWPPRQPPPNIPSGWPWLPAGNAPADRRRDRRSRFPLRLEPAVEAQHAVRHESAPECGPARDCKSRSRTVFLLPLRAE